MVNSGPCKPDIYLALQMKLTPRGLLEQFDMIDPLKLMWLKFWDIFLKGHLLARYFYKIYTVKMQIFLILVSTEECFRLTF